MPDADLKVSERGPRRGLPGFGLHGRAARALALTAGPGAPTCPPAGGMGGQAQATRKRDGVQWSAPELSRFFGIIIRMFAEAGSRHHVAHFHAYYQEGVGIFSIDPVEMIAGSLPRTQRRLVEAWAELHQAELREDWERLQQGQKPVPIEPLKQAFQ